MKDKSIDGPGTALPWNAWGNRIGQGVVRTMGAPLVAKVVTQRFADPIADQNASYIVWSANNAPALVEALQGLLSVWGHKPGTTSRARHEAFLAAKDVLSTALGEMNDE